MQFTTQKRNTAAFEPTFLSKNREKSTGTLRLFFASQREELVSETATACFFYQHDEGVMGSSQPCFSKAETRWPSTACVTAKSENILCFACRQCNQYMKVLSTVDPKTLAHANDLRAAVPSSPNRCGRRERPCSGT